MKNPLKPSSTDFNLNYLAKSKTDANIVEYPQKIPLTRRIKVVSFLLPYLLI